MATVNGVVTGEAAALAARPYERVDKLAEVLSPSQKFCYQDCSARWWFKYGLQIVEPPNGNLSLGKAIHAALAYNFRPKIETREDLPAEAVLTAFDQAWDVLAQETEFRPDENPGDLRETGRGLVALFLREAAPGIRPAAVELRVDGVIGGVRVRAIVDLVEIDGRIHDYKSVARKPSAITADHRFQLATYALLTPTCNGTAQQNTLVKTKTPQLVRFPTTIGDDDVAAVRKQYPLFQAAMRAGYYLPNRGSTLCSRRNCAYWRECESEYGGRVEQS